MVMLHSIHDPKEKLFIKTALDYINRSQNQNRTCFTDFYEGIWATETLKKYISAVELQNCHLFGGYEGAERQMIGFFTPYREDKIFPITCLKIEVKTGIGKSLTHRDYLGALLGLGIERDRIGDIIIKSFGAYVFLTAPMAEYVAVHLTGIGRYGLYGIEDIPFSEVELEAAQTKQIITTVASLRMDAVVAAGFNLSRATCAKLIQAEKAHCNGQAVSNSYLVKQGDSISLKGYGKMKLSQINGYTKKDRIHICIEKYT